MTKEEQQTGTENEQRSRGIAFLTDLDGTLIDHHTYSFEQAISAFQRAKRGDIPIIPTTSKTWAEVGVFQKEVGTYGKDPAIVENGGATYIPKSFIDFDPREVIGQEKTVRDEKGYWIVEYAKPIEKAREALDKMADNLGIKDNILSFGRMTAQEFGKETGLSTEKAELALQRGYQEGYKFITPPTDEEEKEKLEQAMKREFDKLGFNLTIGGRFFQITGGSDKGLATKDLIRIMQKKYGEVYSIGLGDANGDIPMLEACNEGYLVANPQGLAKVDDLPTNIQKVSGVGPEGWSQVVNSVLDRSESFKNETL